MKKELAIKGHPTRGKEVIKILGMLGGREVGYNGFGSLYYYYIDEYGNIAGTTELSNSKTFVTYTLEEFLEKFPYKIGDKVQRNGATSCGSVYVIEKMKWEDNQVKYIICDLYWKNCKCTVTSKDLQPYKEETMEVTKEFKQKYCSNCGSQRCSGDGEWLEECEYYKNEQRTMEEIKIDIPKGYEFAGVDDNAQQVVFTKIQPEYPKTYEECCKILDWNHRDYDRVGYNSELLCKFQVLLLCRDAYWKHAGEQMGLGKPWEPDWNTKELKYIIYYENDKLWFNDEISRNTILAFPTEEMRDAFFENFQELIEKCKELL